MDQDHLYHRSLGMTYDIERAHAEIANGTSGYDGGYDRSNGLENDQNAGELPYALFDTAVESERNAAQYVSDCVSRDLKLYGTEQMLDVDFALDKAMIAYGVELADTSYHLETAVAEYFGSLAEVLLNTDDDEVSAKDIEIFFTETAEQLAALDELVTAQ